MAFFQRDERLLAFALAKRVQGLDGSELSTHASDLISYLVKSGVPRDSPQLTNPWSKRTPEIIIHFALLALVPAVLSVAILVGKPATEFDPVVVASSGRPIDAAPPVVVAQPESATPAEHVAAPPPTCEALPENGAILGGTPPDGGQGHTLEIKNGSMGPAIIKVRDSYTARMLFSFFVAKDTTASVTGIADGSYRIQYALGDQLAADCRSLMGNVRINEFPDIETLTTKVLDNGRDFSVLSYTLYSVPGGNVAPRRIDETSFNAD